MSMFRIRHTIGLAAAATVVAAGLGAAATSLAPSADAAPGAIRIITHNLEKEQGAIDAVKAKIADTDGPEAVLLQEVCRSQVAQLEQLGSVTFRARRTLPADSAKCPGEKLGEAALWTKKDGTGHIRETLITRGGHAYGLACISFDYAGRSTRACSTHLAAGADKDGLRQTIAQRVKSTTRPWIGNGKRVIVAGDFNSNPKDAAMAQLYGVGRGAVGDFREVHQSSGSGTTTRTGLPTKGGRKIDYIFVSLRDTRVSGGTEQTCNGEKVGAPADDYEPNHCTTSDHRVLWGAVRLKAR